MFKKIINALLLISTSFLFNTVQAQTVATSYISETDYILKQRILFESYSGRKALDKLHFNTNVYYAMVTKCTKYHVIDGTPVYCESAVYSFYFATDFKLILDKIIETKYDFDKASSLDTKYLSTTYTVDNSGHATYPNGWTEYPSVVTYRHKYIGPEGEKDYADVGYIPAYTFGQCEGYIEGLGCPDTFTDRTSMKDGPCDICSKMGNPFDVRTGVKYETAVDLDFPLTVSRNYSSKQRTPGMFGANWRTNYDKAMSIIKNKDNRIVAIIFVNTIGDSILFKSTDGTNFTPPASDQRQYKLSISDNQVKLITPEAGIEIYDATTQKIISENYLGQIVNYQYSPNGNLYRVVNQLGKYLEFSYNTSNFVNQITASNGDILSYNYYEGNITTVKNNNISQITYEYGQNGLLTGKLDGNGVKYASFTYDELGRGIENKHMTHDGHDIKKYTFTYNNNGTTVTQENGFSKFYATTTINGIKKITNMNLNGNSEDVQFDTAGNVTQKKNLSGNYENYTYDNDGRILSYTANGKTVNLSYNQYSNILHQTTENTPNGTRTINYSYNNKNEMTGYQIVGSNDIRSYVSRPRDSYGRVIREENDQGLLTTYTYYPIDTSNASGLLKTMTVNTGTKIVVNSYDTRGNPTSITVNGVTKTMSYDYKGRILTETVNGATNTYTYNLDGNMLTSNLASGYALNMTYDTAGRLLTISDNMGGSVVLTNDDYTDDVLKAEISQNNNLVRARNKILDSLGRTVEAYNATTKTKKSINYYTRMHLPDSTTDANGIATNYTWNDLGQNLSYASGNDTSSTMYDIDGNVQTINANNQATTMNYDDLGRITTISSPDTGIRTFTYRKDQDTYTDAKGTLHTLYKGVGGLPVNFVHSNNDSQYNYSNYESYEYDTYGRVAKISSNNSEIIYTRNTLGQLITKSQNPNINGYKQLPVTYAYNSLGQKISDTYPSGTVVTYEYTNGFVASIKVNGTSIVSNVNYNSLLQEATSWTLGGRNVTITKDTDGLLTNFSETGIFNQEITTDNEGHILSLNDSISNNNFNVLLNDNYALVSGTINNKNLEYNFGDNHNLTKQIDGITNYEFTAQYGNNKLENINYVESNTVFNYQYDANGNLKADSKNKYKYDGNNNLEYVETKMMVNGYEDNVMIRYFYNGLNQRIGKQILGGQLKFFVYNENNQVIGEYDSNGAVIAEYVYFGLRPVAVKTNGSLNIVHTDYLGTPRVITSGTNGGNVIWQWKNDNPYGNNKAQGSIEFNLRFAGQYYDSESGLHYNMNRTYNPELGRYLQSDPIGLAGGFNTYNYVNKNPLDSVDPLGLVGKNVMVVNLYPTAQTQSAFVKENMPDNTLAIIIEAVDVYPANVDMNNPSHLLGSTFGLPLGLVMANENKIKKATNNTGIVDLFLGTKHGDFVGYTPNQIYNIVMNLYPEAQNYKNVMLISCNSATRKSYYGFGDNKYMYSKPISLAQDFLRNFPSGTEMWAQNYFFAFNNYKGFGISNNDVDYIWRGKTFEGYEGIMTKLVK